MNINYVQMAALGLLQSDARFLYTLVDMQRNAKSISSNYIMMCQPYIGVFAEGAEQWCKKVGMESPTFTKQEKKYYTELRQGHKIFEKSYQEYSHVIKEKLYESEKYFYERRSLIEKIVGYYNVGTDLCEGEFCGNTVICSVNAPIKVLGNEQAGNTIKDKSVIAGKLANYLGCTGNLPYKYNSDLHVTYRDYHFLKNCPLRMKNALGLELFSIICIVSYTTIFIEQFFVEEIPQKFKFAYLQYYYLCDFLKELNEFNNIKLSMNVSLKNREFRNCLAHYGLGQFMNEDDIIENDVLKGLTVKAFGLEYTEAKEHLYKSLRDLVEQISLLIF